MWLRVWALKWGSLPSITWIGQDNHMRPNSRELSLDGSRGDEAKAEIRAGLESLLLPLKIKEATSQGMLSSRS